MKKNILNTLVYFFTPEDSARSGAQGGDLTFTIGADNLNMGSLKALFWVAGTGFLFYLLTLI